MNVERLIEHLKTLDPNYVVYIGDSTYPIVEATEENIEVVEGKVIF